MNYLYQFLLIGFINISICGLSWAATVVEFVDMGNTQKAIVTEHYARMLNPDFSSYMQLDMKNGKAYMVNTKQKRVLEMDIVGQPPEPPSWGNSQQRDRQPPWKQIVKAELVNKGEGSLIAGYPTILYQLKADGKVCSEIHFSKQAFAEATYLKKLLRTMNKMSSSRTMKGKHLPPCLKAYQEKEAEFMEFGLPLKTVLKKERGDQVKSKVISIKTNVKIAPDAFVLPTDYESKTEQEMRKDRQTKMKEQMEKRRQQRNDWRNEGRQERGNMPYR